jgi:tetraacyldisaccharide 4'-kinase
VPDPRRPHHLLRSTLGPLLAPLYGLAQRLATRGYESGSKPITRFPAPVISIGNLTIGGTGKSPAIKLLARMLIAQGRDVIVAMRGYRAANGISDEAADLQTSVPNTTVLIGANRTANLQAHFATKPISPRTVILLDDGFQHRQIARDLDIVLIDAAGPALDDRLLPWGDLREPVSALKRAHAIILTHADQASAQHLTSLRARLQSLTPAAPLFTAAHTWSKLEAFDLQSMTLAPATLPADLDTYLQHRRAVVITAIGQPARFLQQIKSHLGSDGHLDELLFPDHHAYSPANIQQLLSHLSDQASTEPPLLWTTTKDWIKLRSLLEAAYRTRSTLPPRTLVIIPRVTLTIDPADSLQSLINTSLARFAESSPPRRA